MKRTVKSTVTALLVSCMMTILLPAGVFAAETEPVTYRAYSWADTELLSTVISEPYYFEVAPDTVVFESNEVYVVNGTVTVADRIECGQNVKLVLTDDSTLTAEQGIHVRGSLEIYGSGTLESEIAESFSNIGIDPGEASCNIAVHGGQLDLTNNDEGSCIDAGSGSFSQYAGTIECCSDEGAGVEAGTITIYGGELSSSVEYEAGITADTVTIYDGSLDCEGFYGAGVEGKNITIHDGEVIASSKEGAGLGSGSGDWSGSTHHSVTSCDSITINGGYVNTDSYLGAGIGSGFCGSCRAITINAGDVLCAPTYGGGIGSGVGGTCKTVSINDGCIMCIPSSGYVFHGTDGFGEAAGTMPEIRIGKDVTLYYGQTGEELNSRQFYVTSESRDITKTLKDQTYVTAVPAEYYERINAGTGSVFSDVSMTIIVGCGALLLGAAAGLLLGKRFFGAKKENR